MFSREDLELIEESRKEITRAIQAKFPQEKIDALQKEILYMIEQRAKSSSIPTGLVFLALCETLNHVTYQFIKSSEYFSKRNKIQIVQ